MSACAYCGGPVAQPDRRKRKYCSAKCRRDFWNQNKRIACACGKLMSPSAAMCIDCTLREREENRDARRDQLVTLWGQGATLKQIAATMGSTPNSINIEIVRARNAGCDIPLRRPTSRKSEGLTKQECRQQFIDAIAMGKVRRPARCEDCGEKARVDGHHSDYQRPLYVEWLCRSCHAARHADQRETVAA